MEIFLFFHGILCDTLKKFDHSTTLRKGKPEQRAKIVDTLILRPFQLQ